MTANVRQTPPEPTCGTLWVTCDNSPTFDGTGPQNGPEGTVDMNSIDKLREYALTAASVNATTRAVLAGYVDEIEREVEELRDRDYRNGREDAKGAVEFADRLKAAVDKREDVTLFGVDYTPLPLDADGMPIHVGDVMEWPDGKTFEVVGIGDGTLYYLETLDDGTVGIEWTSTECKRHNAPTVEDVLEEFVARWMETHHDDIPALKAEYAAKLALRGDE